MAEELTAKVAKLQSTLQRINTPNMKALEKYVFTSGHDRLLNTQSLVCKYNKGYWRQVKGEMFLLVDCMVSFVSQSHMQSQWYMYLMCVAVQIGGCGGSFAGVFRGL